jgi:hypothetical protein
LAFAGFAADVLCSTAADASTFGLAADFFPFFAITN